MWAIDNRTGFAAARAFARDAEGAEVWVVAVRATFSFDAEGRVSAVKDQPPARLAPEYFGAPGESSLRYDMDLVRTKPGTDVVLHACAHAPGGVPAPHVDVGWSIGPLKKRLRVVGDRVWEKAKAGLVPGAPAPFVSSPIRWERAWGGRLPGGDGRDPANPIGCGRDAAAGEPLPSCELPDDPIRSPSHEGPPAGFGPIPPHWQPRLARAGTYDETWARERRPLVPTDFQDGHLRCAPADQQVAGFLHGGEQVALDNLTPEGVVRFRLPRVHLGFATYIGGERVYHHRALHTVIVEPEERRIVLVWQTALPCHHDLYRLEETVVFEKRRLFTRGTDPPSMEEG